MFDTPEAACGNGTFLRSCGNLGGCIRIDREACGSGERAEQALDECRHLCCHDKDSDEGDQTGRGERQFEDRPTSEVMDRTDEEVGDLYKGELNVNLSVDTSVAR